MGRIFKVVAARPGETTQSLEAEIALSLSRGEKIVKIPPSMIILTLKGGEVELIPDGGAQ
jgi:hypothetical protein